ncbi:S8 family peptidase [Sphingomonas sp. MMS24-J13]|uniref:S8 family peptidase n=1 Tax=Sphingomonas sp. MMS24-J13 TaxID=3238686 RepID=UPI00385077D0
MANNPVQIVLNDNDYVVPPEPGKGGPPHDFFAGRDEEFAKHKAKLAGSIQRLASQLDAEITGRAGYVRVKLRDRALAKSHRPVRALFRPDLFPSVGAAGLGEIYYFAEANKLADLVNVVSEAEPQTNWVEKEDGSFEARPSVIRSEVGAVEDISIPDPVAKRRFDAQTAVAWLSDARTGGYYLLELFENPRDAERRDPQMAAVPGERSLSGSLEALLRNLGRGIVAWRLPEAGGETPIALKLTARQAPALLSATRPPDTISSEIDVDLNRHEEALNRLVQHPSVRRISLPLRVELSEAEGMPSDRVGALPARMPNIRYPKVGVIDSGLGPALEQWILGRHDYLDEDEVDREHGSFVGGLIVGAAGMNPELPGLEADGCELVDLALYPKGEFLDSYRNGFDDFLAEMDQAIGEAVRNHGIRVVNLSINAVSPVEADNYSYYAARLDKIADKHDVVIVNSAGNLSGNSLRAPWPKRPSDAVRYFAARTDPDTIFKPTESVRCISVGAINPPGCNLHREGLPTTYTRRGPGLRVGCKPDVAHFGGNDGSGPSANHLLASLSPEGDVLTNCGTSFAAPLVSKALASLESVIEGYLPAHALRALLIHNCVNPSALTARGLSTLSRQFVGFGMPVLTSEMLVTDDHSITLVFQSVIPNDVVRPKVLRFDFDWPQALVDPATGSCRGDATATLVYQPPIDGAFGAEFVRVNLDAKLQQRQRATRKDGSPSYRDRFDQSFLPKTAGQPVPEKELINQGLKWWPTKRYHARLSEAGVGESSQWRLEVSATRRAETRFPATGVPFTLVVTIRDPEGIAPIFQQMKRTLQAGRVQLSELTTHQRIQARR